MLSLLQVPLLIVLPHASLFLRSFLFTQLIPPCMWPMIGTKAVLMHRKCSPPLSQMVNGLARCRSWRMSSSCLFRAAPGTITTSRPLASSNTILHSMTTSSAPVVLWQPRIYFASTNRRTRIRMSLIIALVMIVSRTRRGGTTVVRDLQRGQRWMQGQRRWRQRGNLVTGCE